MKALDSLVKSLSLILIDSEKALDYMNKDLAYYHLDSEKALDRVNIELAYHNHCTKQTEREIKEQKITIKTIREVIALVRFANIKGIESNKV